MKEFTQNWCWILDLHHQHGRTKERQLPPADTAPPTIPAAAPAAEAEHAPAEPTEDMAMMDPYLFV